MGENKMIERDLMGQEEFEEYIASMLKLRSFEAVYKFKSVRRAIRKGHVSPDGVIYPKRPFNNRANTSKRKGAHSRAFNETKKQIYGQLKQYGHKD